MTLHCGQYLVDVATTSVSVTHEEMLNFRDDRSLKNKFSVLTFTLYFKLLFSVVCAGIKQKCGAEMLFINIFCHDVQQPLA